LARRPHRGRGTTRSRCRHALWSALAPMDHDEAALTRPSLPATMARGAT
jgi:hypothetical protein